MFQSEKDQCSICNAYYNGDDEYKESAKRGWEEHRRRENETMTVKAADKQRSVDDRNFVAITFDLQAVAYYTLLMQKKDRFTTKGSWQFTTLQ